MPWSDWQFWVVTLVALGALLTILRMVIPKRKNQVRTTLTVGGQKRDRKRGTR